jgi:DNA primase
LLPEQTIEEIKRRTDLVALIGEYVTLKKSGRTYKGLCPFHGEKTPSFHVDPGQGFYHCFGCGQGGDAIAFIREQIGYSFIEALRFLAERVQMDLPDDAFSSEQRAGSGPQRREKRARLFTINKRASTLFQKHLTGKALTYATEKRRLTTETLETFGVGFAPDSWDSLATALGGDNERLRDATALGLVAERSQGASGYYDRFRNRLMFPVFGLAGEVIAFSGRTLSSDPESPKYINSPDSDVFSKGRILFGLYQARRAIRQKSRAILVEGNVDVLMLAQHGFEETVAPMGTALTEEQCLLLKRFSENVVLIYDGDSAGQAAAMKSIPLLLGCEMSGRVVTLSKGEDPDSLVSNGGPKALEELISNAPPLFDFVIERQLQTHDGSVPGIADVVDGIRPLFSLLCNPVERDLYSRRLAQRLQVSEPRMSRWLRRKSGQKAEAEAEQTTEGAPAVERQLMSLVLRYPRFLPFWDGSGVSDPHLTTHAGVRAVLMRALELYRKNDSLDIAQLMQQLENDGLIKARDAVAQQMTEPDQFGNESERAYVEIIDTIKAHAERRDKDVQRAQLRSLSAQEQLATLKDLGQSL